MGAIVMRETDVAILPSKYGAMIVSYGDVEANEPYTVEDEIANMEMEFDSDFWSTVERPESSPQDTCVWSNKMACDTREVCWQAGVTGRQNSVLYYTIAYHRRYGREFDLTRVLMREEQDTYPTLRDALI